MKNKFRLFIAVIMLFAAILACESSETASIQDTDELAISETEIIEEQTPLVQANTPAPKYTSTPYPIDNAIVTANLCNLRSGPGTDYSIVGSVEKDDVVPIFGRNENSDWLLIDYSQSIWIAASLVKLNKNMSAIDIADIASLSNPVSNFSEDVEAVSTPVTRSNPIIPIDPTSAPAPTEPPNSALCDCNVDYDCGDFFTHNEAQACFESCGGSPSYNWSRLDRDGDGIACESLP
jgi:uncharacterized protein YraI